MKLTLYVLKTCTSCRKAKSWCEEQGIEFSEIAIRETPPSLADLQAACDRVGGEARKLFNTSGQDYRSGGYKDRLSEMSTAEALAELAENGNLIKRPFALLRSDKEQTLDAWVGFKEAVYEEKLKHQA